MAFPGGQRKSIASLTVLAFVLAPGGAFADNAVWLSLDTPIVTAPKELPRGRINTTQQDIELIVPVRERGPLGQANIVIGADQSLKVRASDLLGLLARIVTPEAIAALTAQVDAEGYLTPEGARAAGFGLVFDTALLDLAVEVPLEARQRQSLDLGFRTDTPPPELSALPAPFSAFVNYRATLDYLHQELPGIGEGLQSPRVELDIGGNVGPVAFETYLTVDEDNDDLVSRNASRLIYDQPGQLLRWTLGDLIPESSSLQSAPDIAGLSVARLYSLNYEDRFLAGRSNESITVRETSRVEIRVNGAVVRTLSLPAGTYDLRDLPLTQGANAVEIVLESQSGQREVISYDFFNDSTLLAPGIDEFYISGGIQAPRRNGDIDYRQDDPIFSGFYRRGVTEQLTAGANLQATRDAVLIGAEAVYGSAWGLTSVDVAVSERDGLGSGALVRVQHRYSRPMSDLPGSETFNVSVEASSENYGSLLSEASSSNTAYRFAARYSRPLTRRLTAGIGGNYAVGRGTVGDRHGFAANGVWRYDFNTTVDFGATYVSTGLFGEETNIFVNLTRRFGARSTFTAGVESQNGLLRAGYSRAPERALDDWAYSVNAVRTDNAVGLNANAFYIANRGELEIAHDTAFDNDGEVLQQQTSLRALGSVAFANGRFGIGRRVFDSFALVDSHPSLGGRPVLIRGISSLEESGRSGAFGPAVVPLGSYYPQEIPYDIEDLPIGYDLGLGVFQVQPRFHNGYTLTVGSDYFVTATGILLNARGEPLNLRSGRAVSLDDPDAPSPEVITNRVGRFAVSGLAAGRWRLTFQGSPALTYDIVVPADTLFRAGTLSPSGSGE